MRLAYRNMVAHKPAMQNGSYRSLRRRHIYFTDEGPDMVVDGARLPSILRFASCLSLCVTFSSFLGMSGVCCDCSGL